MKLFRNFFWQSGQNADASNVPADNSQFLNRLFRNYAAGAAKLFSVDMELSVVMRYRIRAC